MAEGMLGGVLGDEGDKPEVETPDALAGAEAFASAVAAGHCQKFDRNGIDMIQQKPECANIAKWGLAQQEKII